MYASALVMFIGTPLALASWWGLVPVLLLFGGLVARLRDEEVYLARNLPGYESYRRSAAHRARARRVVKGIRAQEDHLPEQGD